MAAALDTWGRLDGALISVGGPPTGSVMDTPDEAWISSFESVFVGGLRVARAVARGDRGARLDRVRAVQLGAGARWPTSPSPTACVPAWRWLPRRWPTSSGRATSASTACCPGGSAPSGSPSSTSPPVTRRPHARRPSPAIPLRSLRTTRGVRGRRRVPAQPGVILRHRDDAARGRRHAPGALTLLHRLLRRRVGVAGATRPRRGSRTRRPRGPRRTTTAARRRSAARCWCRRAAPRRSRVRAGAGLSGARSTKPR